MPMSICPSCGKRRAVADYIAKLPLRCTGCGHALGIAADEVTESIPVEVATSRNGTPDAAAKLAASLAKPSLAYIGLSNADIAGIGEIPEGESAVEFAPSSADFAIAITPDRELSPLVVSEKISASSFQLPTQILGPASSEESEKSKLAERLKEIASLSSARPVEALPPPPSRSAPQPPASSLRRIWNRLRRRRSPHQ